MEFKPIVIENIGSGGYCPAYWKCGYPHLGNKNQASSMKNIDATYSGYITQGPKLSALANQNVVLTLVKKIMQIVVSDDMVFGAGGNKIYKLSSSQVYSGSGFPHTIDATDKTGEDAQDVIEYKGKIYTTFNFTGGGGVSQLTLANSFNDDFDLTLENAVHQACVGGTDGILAITNKDKIATYNGTIFTPNTFDINSDDSELVSIVWNLNYFWLAANEPNITGSNRCKGKIYVWDGNSEKWSNSIPVKGKIGTLFEKNNVVYVFYQTNLAKNVITLGYVNGNMVSPLANFEGSLPDYRQVTEIEGFIAFLSGQKVFLWGGEDLLLKARLFQYSSATYATGGGIANPFGSLLISSTDDVHYELSKFAGYTKDSDWKGITFNISQADRKGMIDKIVIKTEKIEEAGDGEDGARCDLTLKESSGNALFTKQISTVGSIRTEFKPDAKGQDFRIELDFSEGSETLPLIIKSIIIFPHSL